MFLDFGILIIIYGAISYKKVYQLSSVARINSVTTFVEKKEKDNWNDVYKLNYT
mgnify:CR=1 FL=1